MAITFRNEVQASDLEAVRSLVAATGYFTPTEVSVAVELVEARLNRGDASEYFFIIAEAAGEMLGYAVYGPIACTVSSFDLYWVVVSPHQQGQGLGKTLVKKCEEAAKRLGATRMYIDTSGKAQYQSTRHFYHRCGYEVAAELADFYDVGDSKVVYVRVLPDVPADWELTASHNRAVS
jgi:GNAT superfamily N-acetyltransferase